MEKFPLTPTGFAALEQEYKHLKGTERPAIIEAIAVARDHGDLKENAEYHSAREKQGFIEGRISELETVIGRAEVIDPKRFSGEKSIKFGAQIVLIDEDTEEEISYQVVGHYEANIEQGKLSIQAPLARALIGRSQGDSVTVKTPRGERSYEIEKVNYR